MSGALAHHGWSWTTGGNIDLTGIIKIIRLGNPHGILKIDVEDEEWTAEGGQPWRNKRAGLEDGDLAGAREREEVPRARGVGLLVSVGYADGSNASFGLGVAAVRDGFGRTEALAGVRVDLGS